MKLRIEQFRFGLPLSNTQNLLQILPILLDLQSFLLELLFGSINRPSNLIAFDLIRDGPVSNLEIFTKRYHRFFDALDIRDRTRQR